MFTPKQKPFRSFQMFKFISASLLILSATSFAAADWKVIGETTDCPEKIKILAKEGETFVKAVRNGVEHKLVSQDGSAFKAQDLKTLHARLPDELK